MVTSLILLVFSLFFILFVCAIFTNAIEWFGKVMNLSHGVTGSILAAIGTALPETIIPIIAIVFTDNKNADDIGIGAIAGAPFMLSTLGFAITGLAVIIYTILRKRKLKITVSKKGFSRDLTFFIIVYGIAIVTTFFREYAIIKTVVAISLLFAYLIYVRLTFGDKAMDSRYSRNSQEEVLERFYLSRFFGVKTNFYWICIELIIALLGIIYGAHLFVVNVESVSNYIGIAPLILSILITPIATELPEKLNSVIWIRSRKDTLALGNITGAMVFQSCFPVAFGIMFTNWNLQGITMLSALLALSSALLNLIWLKTKREVNPFILLSGAGFYAIFLLYIIFK